MLKGVGGEGGEVIWQEEGSWGGERRHEARGCRGEGSERVQKGSRCAQPQKHFLMQRAT